MSKKLKDLLSEIITTMGGVVSRPAFTNLDMGFRTQKSTKLTNIVEDMYGDSKPKINVKEFVQEIGQYYSYGNEEITATQHCVPRNIIGVKWKMWGVWSTPNRRHQK